ncbi:MAG: VWA domain-containing protein [Planctomycetota bacterium]
MPQTPLESATPGSAALEAAKRREKVSQAEWRRRRAEVARLIAAGEEQAARELLAEAGVGPMPESDSLLEASPDADNAPMWEASRDADSVVQAVPAGKPTSGSGEPPYSQAPVGTKPAKPTKAKADSRPKSAPKVKRPASRDKQAIALAKQGRAPRVGATKRKRRRRKVTWAEWLRSRPPWMTSLAAHGVLLVLLSLLTFATFGEPGFSLTASLGEDDAWADMPAEITLDALVEDTEALDVDTPIDVAIETDLASLVEPVSFESPVVASSDLLALSSADLMASVPTSASGSEGDAKDTPRTNAGGKSHGPSGKVSFFGSESEGERVVFVVDNSGSMQNGRMETTLLELDNAVKRLSTSQEFYVVFFSDQAYPMFFPTPAEEPLQATQQNKRRLTAWLHTVEMCLGGRLLDAMEIAAGLEPDVVFLLTDGDIRSERVAERMTARDAWPFAIHTLGMGARTPRHIAILSAIAKNTGGVYRPVGANPAAVTRSRLRPIPYHREAGTVWGSAVQAWK